MDTEFNKAKLFCVKWFKLSLDEALLIWKARNQAKHGHEPADLTPWHEIVNQYHNALESLRKHGLDIPDKPTIRKANRAAMNKCIERASELRLSRSILSHIQVEGNPLSQQQQRELQQRLNSRAARTVASVATHRAQRQLRINFPRLSE